MTYSKFGGFGPRAVEAQHNDLQAVAAVCTFEEARLQQVWREARGQVDPPICQAITVNTWNSKLILLLKKI